MSEISLFTSDEALAAEQRSARRHGGHALSPAEQAHLDIADAREVRLHRRMRAFAWWLFVLPVVVWIVGVVVLYLAGSMLGVSRG